MPHPSCRSGVPQGTAQGDGSGSHLTRVFGDVLVNFVPSLLQDDSLGFDDRVLPASLPVPRVKLQDTHDQPLHRGRGYRKRDRAL